jgi:hypothetical protein
MMQSFDRQPCWSAAKQYCLFVSHHLLLLLLFTSQSGSLSGLCLLADTTHAPTNAFVAHLSAATSPDNAGCLTAAQLCFNGAKDAEESDIDCKFGFISLDLTTWFH